MLGVFAGAFVDIARRPMLAVPALLAAIANTAVMLLAVDSFFGLFYDITIAGNVPEAGIVEAIYYVAASHSIEIAVIAAALFINGITSVFLLYTYYALATEKKAGVAGAMLEKIGKITEIAGVAAFLLVAAGAFSAVSLAIFVAAVSVEGLGFLAPVVMIALAAFSIYVFMKLFFTPLFMCSEQEGLKKSLGKCWKWSNKRLFTIAIFFAIVSAIISVLGGIFDMAAVALEGNDIASAVAIIVGLLATNTYFNVAIVKFFLSEKE